MVDREQLQALDDVLGPLPGERGGISLVVASGASPPALAVLSTGDVFLQQDTIRIAVHGGSSVARRLGQSCSLVVPAGMRALRVEVAPAEARSAGPIDVIEGSIAGIRPTAEPPWRLEMSFSPVPGGDVQPTLDYWASVRAWLSAGADGDGPTPPPAG